MATKTGEFSERLKAILDLRGMTQSELVEVTKNFLKNFVKTT